MIHRLSLFLILIFLIVSFSLSMYGGYRFAEGFSFSAENGEELIESESVFETLNVPYYFRPIKISSERIGLDTSVEEVGMDQEGALEVPSTWYTAGWYKWGARPGEMGNMIIDGHYDTSSGAPGAFWALKNVKVNDTLVLIDEVGRVFVYRVTDLFYLDIQDPNRAKVFEDTENAQLTLITCGGVWVPGLSTYDKRLVVIAELVV